MPSGVNKLLGRRLRAGFAAKGQKERGGGNCPQNTQIDAETEEKDPSSALFCVFRPRASVFPIICSHLQKKLSQSLRGVLHFISRLVL